MTTKTLKNFTDKSFITIAIKILNESGVIAFPTETVYGIGCDMFDETAIKKIYEMKGRNFDKPLAAHICDINQVLDICIEIPYDFYILAENFMPGPISIILKKSKNVSDIMTSGMQTIGIRYPDEPIFNEIIKNYGVPLAATSANLSGKNSPVTAEDVFHQLNGKIPLIIDNGHTRYRNESTVISLIDVEPVIIRTGAIDVKEIESVLNKKIKIGS